MNMERKMTKDVKGQEVTVTLNVNKNDVSWKYHSNGLQHTCHLRYRQILGTDIYVKDDFTQLNIHYVKVLAKNRYVTLRHETATFLDTNENNSKEIADAIECYLKDSEPNRPKRLLVFLNPMSGAQDNVTKYAEVVEPLFNKAGVTAHVIVTKDRYHALDVLAEYDLEHIDGVVSMGGDGSYGQIYNALMMKVAKDTIPNKEDMLTTPPTCTIPFGVLPGGSGSAIARAANSTIDLETCALSIILGKTEPGDTIIVEAGGAVIRYAMFIVASGGFVNAFDVLEDFRWLKKARYWLIVPVIFWIFGLFDAEIQYLPVAEEENEFFYHGEPNPSEENPTVKTVDGPLPGWKTLSGNFTSLYVIPSSLIRFFKWASETQYTKPKLTSGKSRLLVGKTQKFWKMIWGYLKANRNYDANDQMDDGGKNVPREALSQIEVREVKVKLLQDNMSIFRGANVDGELHKTREYSAKIFEKKYKLFVIDDDLVSEALEYDSP